MADTYNMLEIHNIDVSYGNLQVIYDLSMDIHEGKVVTLLGRNGMGKTTLMRSIVGINPPRNGKIMFKGESIGGEESYKIARKGISYVPQGRGIFPSLTTKENLLIGAKGQDKPDAWNLDRVYDFFPILKERAGTYGNLLSGGEQQMLAIGRALMTNPDLLIMDEPSEGLAPMVIKQIGDVIQTLKGKLTVFLAEQNFNMAVGVADYVYIMSQGQLVHRCYPQDLVHDEETKKKWLGV